MASIDETAVFLHKQWNGKIETTSKAPVKNREDLSIAYTPGVAAPCRIIAEDKEQAYNYTIKANTVAVVSDGSAVLVPEPVSSYPHACTHASALPYHIACTRGRRLCRSNGMTG